MIRIVKFTDRFEREHVIVFLDSATERRCANAYGEHWPTIKKHLGAMNELSENLKRLVK